jgi:hemoglobin
VPSKRLFSCIQSFVAAAVLGTLLLAVPARVRAQEKSLYDRLGGYNAIAAVVDEFIKRLATDPQEGRFFVGHSTDSQKRIRQHVVDQLCMATGGPCVYTGRDMKTAHAGLKITEADWDISVKHLSATLEQFKVPEKEKGEVLGAISSFKKDIVEVPTAGMKK